MSRPTSTTCASASSVSAQLIVLIGPPGAGKTSVGKALAKLWDVGFRDTDADVEQSAGQSVADIFVEAGEPAFRELETAAVAIAIAEHEGVLALGGGAVMSPATQELLADQQVVFLDVGVAQAMRRLGMNRSRPLLLGNVRGQWQKLAAARRPVYERLATHVIGTDGQSVEEVVQQIVSQVKEQQ